MCLVPLIEDTFIDKAVVPLQQLIDPDSTENTHCEEILVCHALCSGTVVYSVWYQVRNRYNECLQFNPPPPPSCTVSFRWTTAERPYCTGMVNLSRWESTRLLSTFA